MLDAELAGDAYTSSTAALGEVSAAADGLRTERARLEGLQAGLIGAAAARDITRGHFPSEQAALKHLYLTLTSLDPTGHGRAKWTNRWKAPLNAFDLAFDGRLSAGRK
ncbi:hypothetical protein FRAHR75_1100007 [Frankia sp. Hr75.2]|nr:hypothetical protein FRAHR75_1100007 [Frankia sp. Hr75.2]